MPTIEMLKKQFIAKIETNSDERTVTAIISTSAVDRDKEVVVARGIDFEQYLKNPVVLWAHNSWDTPIGKAMWLKRTGKKIIAKIKFADTDKAEEVYQLYKGGFLSAFSIGFIPTKRKQPEPDDIKKNPDWADARMIIEKSELLEFSAVPVPANPEALVTAVKNKDISISDDTIDELDLEIEEYFEPVGNKTSDITKDGGGDEKTNTISVKSFVPAESLVTKCESIKEVIRVESYVDVAGIVAEEIKKLKGQVY